MVAIAFVGQPLPPSRADASRRHPACAYGADSPIDSPAQHATPGGASPGVMPTTVVDVVVVDGALSAGVLPSTGAVVVVVSDGRGACITVVKSDPVINETWFGASVGSDTSSAP